MRILIFVLFVGIPVHGLSVFAGIYMVNLRCLYTVWNGNSLYDLRIPFLDEIIIFSILIHNQVVEDKDGSMDGLYTFL